MKIQYKIYTIIPMEFDDRTVFDVYLGDGQVYRETFKTVEKAKEYIDYNYSYIKEFN